MYVHWSISTLVCVLLVVDLVRQGVYPDNCISPSPALLKSEFHHHGTSYSPCPPDPTWLTQTTISSYAGACFPLLLLRTNIAQRPLSVPEKRTCPSVHQPTSMPRGVVHCAQHGNGGNKARQYPRLLTRTRLTLDTIRPDGRHGVQGTYVVHQIDNSGNVPLPCYVFV